MASLRGLGQRQQQFFFVFFLKVSVFNVHPSVVTHRLDGSSAPDGIIHKDKRIEIKRPDGLIGGWSGGWLWFKSISNWFEYWMIDGGHEVRPTHLWHFHISVPHNSLSIKNDSKRNWKREIHFTVICHWISLSFRFNAGGRKVSRKRREKDRSNPSSLTGVVFSKCTCFAWSRYCCRRNVPLSSASVKTNETNK